MTSIMDLPPEMTAQIMQYLKPPQKRTCRLVCESWRSILDYHFHKFTATLDDSSAKYILNCRNSIRCLAVGALADCKLPMSRTRSRSCFAETKLVDVKQAISHTNLVQILDATGETVECMLFENGSLQNLWSRGQVWKHLGFPALQLLTVSMTRFDSKHHQAVLGLLQHGSFPSLTKFHLDLAKPFEIDEHDASGAFPVGAYQNLCPALIKFLARHAPSLNKLALILPTYFKGKGSKNGSGGNGRNLEELAEAEGLENLKLMRMGLNIPAQGTGSEWSLCHHLLKTQSAIKNLVILGHPLTESDAQAIQRNSDTLEILFWASTTRNASSSTENQPQPYTFDCSLLHGCKKLQKMEIITSRPVRNIELLPVTLTKLCWAADLTYAELKWITTHLVNLTTFSLVVENYLEVETHAKILPITCTILANDILHMPKLVKLNLQCHCHLRRILNYCEMSDGLTAIPKHGLTIYVDRQEFQPRPWQEIMDEYIVINLVPFLMD